MSGSCGVAASLPIDVWPSSWHMLWLAHALPPSGHLMQPNAGQSFVGLCLSSLHLRLVAAMCEPARAMCI